MSTGITPMQKVSPCLWFDGQAEQAAEFYVSLVPDSRIDRVTRFVGLNGGPQFPFTEAVSFQIACADQAEVDRLWSALSEGGSEVQCGWLNDRWGLSWQIVPTRLLELFSDPDPGRSRRAAEAMMKMIKIDIAEVERAADGA